MGTSQQAKKFDPSRGVKYQYVIDEVTRAPVLLPRQDHKGVITGREVYLDSDGDHKGHTLLCPDCEQAFMTYVPESKRMGNIRVRGHFKISNRKDNPGHSEDCISELRGDPYSSREREFDYSKGPIIYMNSLAPEFNERASGRVSRGRNVFFEEDEKGILRFRPEYVDLADRESFSVKNAGDLFRVISRLPLERLQDAKIIYGSSVVSWDQFVIKNIQQRAGVGEIKFSRFINLARDLFDGKFHPVLIHFNSHLHKPRLVTFDGETGQRVSLPRFRMDHNGRGVTVIPLVTVFGEEAKKDIREPGRKFVLGLPKEMRPVAGSHDRYFMIVDVYTDALVAGYDIETLRGLVGSKSQNGKGQSWDRASVDSGPH
ncbi:MAG TPA: hypothetical protein PLK94_09685 [Alphaproteobacteria bacterium]|nr:hypothetical protein [Alphaproteobacteria bacterium]